MSFYIAKSSPQVNGPFSVYRIVMPNRVLYNRRMSKQSFTSVLITGASSGIGAALAERLAGPGIALCLTGRDANRLAGIREKVEANGGTATAHVIDVQDASAMANLIADTDSNTPLDLVIANAGISGGAGISTDDAQKSRTIFDINVGGVINTVLPAAHAMKTRRHGHIGIVSSVAGFRGLPTAPAYSASKVAVRAWGEAIRPHLHADGVGLSIIYPGFVESRITDANNFAMPFLMPAEKAADIIATGLISGERSIAFPWPTVMMARLLSILPTPIFDAVMRNAPRKT